METCSQTKSLVWKVAPNRDLQLDKPRLMGVLNVTPDSFSDGGLHKSSQEAVDHALRMVDEGACIIDIGGESSRPGADGIDANQQIARTIPVIKQLREQSQVLISIDTTRSSVAEAALDAGANIINDISAGCEDDQMFNLAANRGCGLILMHRLASPQHDSYSDQYNADPIYDDVVQSVCKFLSKRCEAAKGAGVESKSIVIDPGLGFGKSVEQCYELIKAMDEIQSLGFPVLCAVSRKSFIGAVTGKSVPADRVIGSAAVSVMHYQAGVRLFRVHDVAATCEALAVASAVYGPVKTD